jgi:hypothetical protein
VSRWARSAAALAALAVLAGCGDSKKIDENCLLRLQATARADTIINLYRRGELGTRAQLERFTGEKIPFLDKRGRIIPYERMNEQQHLDTDNFALKATSMNDKVILVVRDAVRRVRSEAATRCT